MANLPLCTHRYTLLVSYIGSRYLGSQRLIKRDAVGGAQDTIQEALEVSLESVFPKERCRCTAGSRTDRGVHSLMSCYTLPLMDFSTPTDRIKRLANAKLIREGHDIIINNVFLAPAEFHPRKSCVSREYIYRIGVPKNQRRTSQMPLKFKFRELFEHFPASELYRLQPLPCFDLDRAEEACDLLRGTHDFASFSHQTKETDDTIRNVDISIVPANDLTFESERSSRYDIYHFHFSSRAFLYNQIRRMMGTIISYAAFDSMRLDEIQTMLDRPDSKCWPNSLYIAEPWGLYLSRMNYDKSSFQGTMKTYDEDPREVEVPVTSIPCSIEMSDDLRWQQVKKDRLLGEGDDEGVGEE